jgi:hypothetical protein
MRKRMRRKRKHKHMQHTHKRYLLLYVLVDGKLLEAAERWRLQIFPG